MDCKLVVVFFVVSIYLNIINTKFLGGVDALTLFTVFFNFDSLHFWRVKKAL
ncbi:hypothetical protein KCTC52924_00862 [Arenibacter antarcticus]